MDIAVWDFPQFNWLPYPAGRHPDLWMKVQTLTGTGDFSMGGGMWRSC